jgi:hypothetical protein
MDPASLSLPGGIVYHYLLNYQLRIWATPPGRTTIWENPLGNITAAKSILKDFHY